MTADSGQRTGNDPPGQELVAQPVEGVPANLWERLRAEPQRAPEHIALVASERFAEPARRWSQMMLAGHAPAEAAEIARRKHVNMSRMGGAVTGLGGAASAGADMLGLLWIQSRMVFFIAAAHGFDPADPMRPAELLALKDVYPTPAEARAGLDGVSTSLANAMIERSLARAGSDEQLTLRLMKYAGRKVAKRAVLRVVPLVASPIAATQNARATSALGERTLRYYGG